MGGPGRGAAWDILPLSYQHRMQSREALKPAWTELRDQCGKTDARGPDVEQKWNQGAAEADC